MNRLSCLSDCALPHSVCERVNNEKNLWSTPAYAVVLARRHVFLLVSDPTIQLLTSVRAQPKKEVS